jgi:signal transduction histidine kinase
VSVPDRTAARSRARPGVTALTCGAAVLGAVVTAAVIAIPEFRFGYREPRLHVVVETTAALVSLILALLALGRFRRSRELGDVLLAAAFVLLSAVNLIFSAVPAAVQDGPSQAATWGALAGRMVGGLLLTVAAAGPRRVVDRRRGTQLLVGGPAVGIGLAIVLAAAAPYLPRAVDPELSPAVGLPGLAGDPTVVAAQLLAAVLYAAAAAGFLRRARRAADPLLSSLAVGCVLRAYGALNYALFPSLFTEWVYLGDLFRLAFYLVILVGASREITGYWRGQSRLAVLEERRRLARDLHDGLAQELAYIVRNTGRLGSEDPTVERIRSAAERALSESRQAIQALSSTDQPLHEAVAEAVGVAARRAPVALTLDLSADARADLRQQECLVRIAAEAVTNAARHSGSDSVHVELRAGPPVRLRVVDGGCGFANGQDVRPSGFGLTGMAQRAATVGARLQVDSAPARGTTVEVEL